MSTEYVHKNFLLVSPYPKCLTTDKQNCDIFIQQDTKKQLIYKTASQTLCRAEKEHILKYILRDSISENSIVSSLCELLKIYYELKDYYLKSEFDHRLHLKIIIMHVKGL